MKKLYVPYLICKSLKEKGFDEPCLFMYFRHRMQKKDFPKDLEFVGVNYNNSDYCVSAPFYQQVIDWFRENHGIIIEIQLDQTSNMKWGYVITEFLSDSNIFENRTDVVNWFLYQEYYDAFDAAITEALELI